MAMTHGVMTQMAKTSIAKTQMAKTLIAKTQKAMIHGLMNQIMIARNVLLAKKNALLKSLIAIAASELVLDYIRS